MPWIYALRLAASRWFVGFMWLGLALISAALSRIIAKGMSPPKYGGMLGVLTTPLRLLAPAAERAARFIEHKTTQYAAHHMTPLTNWLEAAGDRQLELARANIAFAESIAIGIEHGFEVKVPRDIKRATRPIAKRAGKALALAGLTAAALRRYRHGIDRLLHDRIIPQVRRATHATTVTLPRALGRIRTRTRALEREAFGRARRAERSLSRRLSRVEKLLGLAALTGVVVRVLVRRFPWLFCRNVKTVGRRVCNLDSDLLEALLLETLVFTSLFYLKEFARAVADFTGFAEQTIGGFVQEWPTYQRDYLS